MLPAAVLLDMDGTLVDSETVYTEAIARFMASQGVELDARERNFVIGHAWQDIYAELRVAERLGIELPAMIEGTISMRGPMREEGLDLTILDGARELLVTMTRLEIPVAVVSGSARAELAEAIALLGIEARLRFWMGAEDYPRGKPAPDGYLRAAERLAVEPARCMVFEDSIAGIAAGVAAGMRVVATAAANQPVGAPGHQDQSAAHRVVPGLAGIDELFLREVMRGP